MALICEINILAGVAPPRRMVSRIFALTALRAFFFGAIRMKCPLYSYGRDADRTRGTRRPHLSTGSPLWFSPRLTRPRAERVVLGVVARPVKPSPVYCGDHRR